MAAQNSKRFGKRKVHLVSLNGLLITFIYWFTHSISCICSSFMSPWRKSMSHCRPGFSALVFYSWYSLIFSARTAVVIRCITCARCFEFATDPEMHEFQHEMEAADLVRLLGEATLSFLASKSSSLPLRNRNTLRKYLVAA